MIFRKVGLDYIVRMEKGDIFFESLIPFLQENNIKAAFFYGLGGADWAELGLYDLNDREYHFKYFSGPLEITNITGNISMVEGQHKVHAHATISGPDMLASGGHVRAIGIGPTCELYIKSIPGDLSRSFNDEVGLELLDL